MYWGVKHNGLHNVRTAPEYRKARKGHHVLVSLLFVLIILVFQNATAQSKTFRLEADQSIDRASWRDSVYLLPSFEKGKLTYIDGFTPNYTIMVNYNMYFENMYFIKSEGDTVPLKKHKALKLVTVAGRQFFYDYKNGYVEVIMQGYISLGRKEVFGFLGQVIESNIHGKSQIRFVDFADVRGTAERNDRLYQRDSIFYLIDHKNNVYPAKRSSILRLCPKADRKKVASHLDKRKTKVPFTQEELLNVLQMFSNNS